MPGIDDFKDLSNAVVDGGNKMKASLSNAVEAAKGMDKILDAVTKQQTKALRIAKSYRTAIKSTAERMGAVRDSASGVKKSVHDISASFESAQKAAKGFGAAISDASGELARLAKYDVEMSGLALAQNDMEKLTKASTSQLKVQKEMFKLGKRQFVQTQKSNKEFKLFRDYSKSSVRNIKLFNKELKSGKTLGEAFSDALGAADIQGMVSLDVDQAKLDAVRDSIIKLRAEIEGSGPIRLEMDLSKLEEAEIRLDELYRMATKPVVAATAPAPAPAVTAAAIPKKPAVILRKKAAKKDDWMPPAGLWKDVPPGTPTMLPKEDEDEDVSSLTAAKTKDSKATKENTKFTELWDTELKKVDQSIAILKGNVRNGVIADPDAVRKESGDLAELHQSYKSFKDIVGTLNATDKATLKQSKSVEELNAAMMKIIGNSPKLIELFKSEADAAREVAESDDTLEKSMNRQFSVINQVRKSMRSGAAEAQEFAGGVKSAGGVMAGAGLAAFFLFKKLGELAGQYKDAAVNLKRFNVELEAQSKRMFGAGASAESFKRIRNELSLTREQSGEFFDVLNQGVNSAAGPLDRLVKAASQLRETFGGDQTKRLKEYVDLLNEIPTIDTDLSVTATADDRAAALFALAQKGKIGSVIELQAAGLAGGTGKPQASSEDVKLLNNAQRTDKTVQDIKDGLLNKFFPTWGPQFAAIADNTFKLLSVVSAGFAMMGAMKFLTAAKAAGGAAPLMKSLPSMLKTALVGSGGAAAAKTASTAMAAGAGAAEPMAFGAGEAVSAIKLVGKESVVTAGSVSKLGLVVKGAAGTLAIAGIAFEAAGMGADWIGGKFEDAGNKTAASVARLDAGLLKFYAATLTGASIGAAIGTAALPIPGFGTAIGAVAGAVVGAAMNFESVGQEAQALGKTFGDTKKYSKGVAFFGKALEIVGKGWEGEGKLFSGALSNLWLTVKTGAGGLWDLAVAAKNNAIYSDEELNKRKANAKAVEEATATIEKIGFANDVLAKKMEQYEKVRSTSAIEMGRIFGRLNSEINSAKKALFDFNKELANVQLGNLAKIGGTSEQFNSSLGTMTKAVRGRFEMQMKAYDQSRKDILANGKLDATSRRDSLNYLAKAEADVAKEFVDGMNAAIEALYKAPGLIAAGLKQKIAKAEFDIQLEAKTLGLEEAGEKWRNNVESTAKTQKETQEAGAKAIGVAARSTLIFSQRGANTQLEAAQALSKAGGVVAKNITQSETRAVEFDPSVMEDIPAEYAKRINKALVGGAGEGKVAVAVDTFNQLPEEVKKALGATKEIVIKSADVNADALRSISDAGKKKIDELNKAIGELREGLVGTDLGSLVSEMSKLNKRGGEYAAAVTKGEKELEGMTAGTPEFKKQEEEIASNKKSQEGINQQRAELNEKIEKYKKIANDTLSKSADLQNNPVALAAKQKEVAEAIDTFVNFSGKSKEEMAAAAESLASLNAGGDAIFKGLAEQTERLNQLGAKDKELLVATKEVYQIDTAIAKSTENITPILEAESTALAANNEALRASMAALREIGKLDTSMLDDRKRELDVINARAGVDSVAGKGLENHVLSIRKQLDVYKEQASLYEQQNKMAADATAELDAQTAENEKKIAALGEGSVEAKNLKDKNKELMGKRKALQDGRKDAEKNFRSMMDDMIATGTDFQDTLESLSKRPEFKRVTAELDFSGAQMEAAAFSDDWDSMMRKSVAMAAQASKERLALEKESLNAEYEERKKSMEAKIDLGVGKPGGMTKEEAAIAKAELGRTLEVNKQLEMSKKETAQKKAALEAVKQAAALATEMVDMQQQVTDAESQFLTEIGGNWQTILDLQSQSVQYERQKADIAAQYAKDVEASGTRGKELAQAQTAAKLAELKYQQKALGAQKSAYEGILGMAFGAIRSSVGARKGLDSAVMKLGREGSRVKTRSGMFRGTGEGKVMTIEQRSALGQLGGVGGAGVAGGTPKKLTTDEIAQEQLKEAEKTRKNTEDGAKAGVSLLGLASGNSVSVQDKEGRDWLSKICDYTGKTVEALSDLFGYVSGSSSAKGERKVDKQALNVQKSAEKTAEENATEAAKSSQAVAAKVAESADSQKGAEVASKEVAGKVADVDLSLADQLKLAKAEFQAANKQLAGFLDNKGTTEQIGQASALTADATEKVLKIQDRIRVNEMKSPLAGGSKSIEGMADILHGGVATPAQDAAKFGSDLDAKISKFGSGATKSGTPSKTDIDAKESARVLAATGGITGGPGSTEFPDWESYRYDVAAAIGDKLNVNPDETPADSLNLSKRMLDFASKQTELLSTPGSIYTHDTTLEEAVLGLGKTMETTFSRQAGGVETAPGQTAAGFAGMGEEAGVGGAGAMKVTGEITVKFDSKMFKTQVTQIVGEVIRSGDIRKSLSQQGFANKVNGI